LNSIRTASITYEVTTLGTSSEQSNFQNIPMIVYADSFNQTIAEKGMEIPDIQAMDNNDPIKGIQLAKGNKSVYGKAMFSLDGTLMGLLMVDYVRRKHELTADERMYLTLSAEQIAGYI